MKYQEFEKGLRKKFQNASEQVDTKALLVNLHAAKPKKERKIILWCFLSFCVITLGYSGVNYFTTPTNETLAENHSVSTSKNRISEAVELPFSKNTSSDISISDLKKETPEEQIKLSIAQNLKQEPIENRKNNNKLYSHNKISTSFTPSTSNSKEIQIKESLSDNLGKMSVQTKNLDEAVLQEATLANDRSFAKLELLPLHGKDLDHSKDFNPNFVICPTFKKPRWALDLIPEIGIIRPFKNLSNNSSEASPIFTMRSDDENTLEAIQAGLYLRARAIQKPLYIKAGISYTRISERMKLNTTWIERDTTVGIISITQSQNGDTITTIMGDIITETEHFRTSSDHYYLHLIDLPVALGYNKSLGNSWRLGLEAGVQFNLAFQSSGKLLEGSGENSFTKLPAEGRFRTRLGISYFGGLTLEKTLSPRTAFYVTPRIRFFNNTFSDENYSINQNYFFAGIHTGFVYTIK